MKHLAIILALVPISVLAQPQVVITPQGTNVVSQSGSTTYITGSPNTGIAVAPVVNASTGIGMVHTPSGSYLIQRSGSTTTVIQTSKSR